MNSAIIVAAGQGKRFGGGRPKQFAEILGKPVLVHTLERFELCPAIDQIILVVSEQERIPTSELLQGHSITKLRSLVIGGETRSHSVLNGLIALGAENAGLVAIHDGARPVVPQRDIESVLRAAGRSGAASLVAPVTDTIKFVEEGRIVDTAERRSLRRALTPQCFSYEVIVEAFEALGPDDYVTDDCSVVEAKGGQIEAVEGSPSNIKITYEHDLAVAEMFLRELLDRE